VFSSLFSITLPNIEKYFPEIYFTKIYFFQNLLLKKIYFPPNKRANIDPSRIKIFLRFWTWRSNWVSEEWCLANSLAFSKLTACPAFLINHHKLRSFSHIRTKNVSCQGIVTTDKMHSNFQSIRSQNQQRISSWPFQSVPHLQWENLILL